MSRARLLQTITDVLDILALLLFATGVAAAVAPWLGWAALAPAGLVVLGGSQVIAHLGARGGEQR